MANRYCCEHNHNSSSIIKMSCFFRPVLIGWHSYIFGYLGGFNEFEWIFDVQWIFVTTIPCWFVSYAECFDCQWSIPPAQRHPLIQPHAKELIEGWLSEGRGVIKYRLCNILVRQTNSIYTNCELTQVLFMRKKNKLILNHHVSINILPSCICFIKN